MTSAYDLVEMNTATPTRHPSANGKVAVSALKASDRKLARLIDAIGPIDPQAFFKRRPAGDAFSVLVSSIIRQQISGSAADAIAGRLRDLFGGRMPKPAELLAADLASLKRVGLSGQKVTYIRSLAEHVTSGELDVEHLHRLPDDEVRRQITACKGIGPWTADSFLLIYLRRPDVLSAGDLGIRQAVQRLYKLDHLPAAKEVEDIGQKWRPHRSLAGFYLWASNSPAAAAALKGSPSPLRGGLGRGSRPNTGSGRRSVPPS
jgi:DNA-3-methyladenine glycosylase II